MKRIFILFLILQFVGSYNAQTDSVYYGMPKKDTTKIKKHKNKDWMKKITYGGNFALSFGNYTYINISPTIGYNVSKKLNMGVGAIYNYFSINYGSQYGRISQTVYGSRAYTRYLFSQSLFLQAQYDRLLQSDFYNVLNPEKKVWVDYVMVGGGYRVPLGNHSSMVASIMYNLTPTPLSIYQNPYIQIGFSGRF
ncbi:MAG: hypothetical protein SFY56_12600 [Bacteroidota bacterium]|nr:hypothetical protein [Bacteroidota bacterium]